MLSFDLFSFLFELFDTGDNIVWGTSVGHYTPSQSTAGF